MARLTPLTPISVFSLSSHLALGLCALFLLVGCRGSSAGRPPGQSADSLVFSPVALVDDCTAAPPEGMPCRARVAWSEADLRARWRAEGRPVWRDGDTLTVVYEGPANAVRLEPTLLLPLSRFAGTSLWVLSARIPDIESAAFSFRTARVPVQETADPWHDWRGPEAPPAPPHVVTLQGTLRTDSLDSQALDERRAVSVYLPPHYSTARTYPVVYMADGQDLLGFARYLDPQILSGTLPPLAVVALHHGGEQRHREYSSQSRLQPDGSRQFEGDHPRYVAHERFLTDEVVPWAERLFSVERRPEGRAVFGYSSGGPFAVAMVLRHPDLFRHALSFSCAPPGEGFPGVQVPTGRPLRFYLASGRLESASYRAEGSALAARLEGAGFDASYRERGAGHDLLMWHEEFPEALRWAFGALGVPDAVR